MGACYSVALAFKVKTGKEEELINAMEAKIANGEADRTRYCEIGTDNPTLMDLLDVVFDGCSDGKPLPHETPAVAKEGYIGYASGFDASYGWECVMWDMWEVMAPFLEENSVYYVCPDEGEYYLQVNADGTIRQTHNLRGWGIHREVWV